jgi:hypothetical protein
VVVGKVINRELGWRNVERETVLKEELAFYFVLELRFMLVTLSSSRLTRRYLRIRYDNFMFIEN